MKKLEDLKVDISNFSFYRTEVYNSIRVCESILISFRKYQFDLYFSW